MANSGPQLGFNFDERPKRQGRNVRSKIAPKRRALKKTASHTERQIESRLVVRENVSKAIEEPGKIEFMKFDFPMMPEKKIELRAALREFFGMEAVDETDMKTFDDFPINIVAEGERYGKLINLIQRHVEDAVINISSGVIIISAAKEDADESTGFKR